MNGPPVIIEPFLCVINFNIVNQRFAMLGRQRDNKRLCTLRSINNAATPIALFYKMFLLFENHSLKGSQLPEVLDGWQIMKLDETGQIT